MQSKPPSGKFVIRLSPTLHKKLKQESQIIGCSLNEYCVSILSKRNDAEANSSFALIVSEILKEFHADVLGIILFGSQARQDFHDRSDTDILVIMKSDIPIVRALYRRVPATLDETISIHFAHRWKDPAQASSLLLECAIDGKVLYDPTEVITVMLGDIRSYILAGKVTRKVTHGQGFWIHQ